MQGPANGSPIRGGTDFPQATSTRPAVRPSSPLSSWERTSALRNLREDARRGRDGPPRGRLREPPRVGSPSTTHCGISPMEARSRACRTATRTSESHCRAPYRREKACRGSDVATAAGKLWISCEERRRCAAAGRDRRRLLSCWCRPNPRTRRVQEGGSHRAPPATRIIGGPTPPHPTPAGERKERKRRPRPRKVNQPLERGRFHPMAETGRHQHQDLHPTGAVIARTSTEFRGLQAPRRPDCH